MSKLFQVYGVGQALFPVLPPPIAFENAPTSNQTNYEIGQIVYTPPLSPTSFYLYGGAGNWIQFASNSGDIIAINGTTNQVTATTSSGISTLSIPSTFVAPGSIAATTTLTATSGNITATNGNLVLSAAGNKLLIHATTAASDSVGTTSAMTGTPGTVTVTSSAVTTSSIILFSKKTTGGTAGNVSITSQSAGSFVLTSTANETSTFNYLIIN